MKIKFAAFFMDDDICFQVTGVHLGWIVRPPGQTTLLSTAPAHPRVYTQEWVESVLLATTVRQHQKCLSRVLQECTPTPPVSPSAQHAQLVTSV